MKRFIKILLIAFSVIIVFLIGFIITLQLFEFRPEDIKVLDVQESGQSVQIQSDQTITILTFNTGYASLSQTEDFVMDGGEKAKMDSKEEVEANINGISSILLQEDADIYLLQEVDTDSKRSYEINQYEHYQSLLAMNNAFAYNYRSIFVPFPLNPSQMMGKVNSGITTFSKFEIDEATRIQLPGSFPWPVRLANLKRALLITRLPIEGSDKDLVVINAHLSAYDDGNMRVQELEALQNIMSDAYENGDYVIVGGDFNQTFPAALNAYENQDNYQYTPAYELIEEDLWEAFPLNPTWFNENNYQLIADALIPTCRLLHQPYDTINHENNQYYLIDGFIASSNIQVLSYETLDEDFMYSDHNPVKITIQFN